MYTRILAAGLIALGLASSAVMAGDDNGKEQRKSVYRCSNVTGKYVMNGTGDNADTLGHIEDAVINLKTGQVVYYVLSHGETLGFGGRYFAIAPEAMRLTNDGDYFILNGVSNKDLDDREGFDANKWPRQPDRRFGKGGEKDVREGADNGKAGDGKDLVLARTSRVIGMACRTPKNDSLGSIYDLALSLQGDKHKVAYAAVSYGGTLGVGGKLYAVPLDKMRLGNPELRPSERVFIINTTQEQFRNLDGFTSGDNWPAMANREFWSKVRAGSADKDNDE
jgi:sporulation protein YlmC with PRC-barrel domain